MGLIDLKTCLKLFSLVIQMSLCWTFPLHLKIHIYSLITNMAQEHNHRAVTCTCHSQHSSPQAVIPQTYSPTGPRTVWFESFCCAILISYREIHNIKFSLYLMIFQGEEESQRMLLSTWNSLSVLVQPSHSLVQMLNLCNARIEL